MKVRQKMMSRAIHILRYGTVAEKVHLEKAISAYDYLSINGNTAAYVSSAIAKFIVEKFFSNPEKGFFIDPITHAFQNEIKLLWTTSKTTGEESIRKSIKKLMEVYGFPANKIKNKTPIMITDFSVEETRNTFCDNVLTFQYNLVSDHIKNNDLQKYLDYIAPDQFKNILQLRPRFLIAPYFYLDTYDPDWQNWLHLNIEFTNLSVAKAKTNFGNCPVFSQIVLNKSIIVDEEARNKIIAEYKKVDCSGFTIWVDDLSEHESSVEELSGFMKILAGLHEKPIYNMYGGFFSILLTHKSIGLLSGVSHGLEYGESRKVYPVGGGIPVSKYYFLPLHHRLDFTKAFYLLEYANIIDTSKENWGDSQRYYNEICKCSQCKNVIKKEMINFIEFESREFYEVRRKDQVLRRKKASNNTKQNCLYHYLLCKKMEFLLVNKEKLAEILMELNRSEDFFSQCEAIHDGELGYIGIWNSALMSYSKEE